MRLSNQRYIYWTAIILLVLTQLFFTYKGVENTPFFQFGMFTEPSVKTDKIYFVLVDSKAIRFDKQLTINPDVLLYNFANYELAIAGDTQISKVISHRLEYCRRPDWSPYLTNALCNSQAPTLYRNWIIKCIRSDFPTAHQIEIGYYILDEKLHIKQRVFL